MATTRYPRHGSLAYWPRKRASNSVSRVRNHPVSKDVKILGFAGYKVGMTHIAYLNNRQGSHTKGMEIVSSVTIIECPPLKVASIRYYKSKANGKKLVSEVFSKVDPILSKKASVPKNDNSSKADEINPEQITEVRLNVYTQPSLTTLGKKKPELFELAIGGSLTEQMAYAKNMLGKEIKVQDILKEGQQVDIYSVTKGKGFQGPVRRFGIDLKGHKTEKGTRNPGNVGPWTGNRSWTVSHAGQTGYHNRMERNKWILRISDDPKAINVDGGHLQYGLVRGTYLLLKGSVGGARKRMIKMIMPKRKNKLVPEHAPQITFVSTQSKQGL